MAIEDTCSCVWCRIGRGESLDDVRGMTVFEGSPCGGCCEDTDDDALEAEACPQGVGFHPNGVKFVVRGDVVVDIRPQPLENPMQFTTRLYETAEMIGKIVSALEGK